MKTNKKVPELVLPETLRDLRAKYKRLRLRLQKKNNSETPNVIVPKYSEPAQERSVLTELCVGYWNMLHS